MNFNSNTKISKEEALFTTWVPEKRKSKKNWKLVTTRTGVGLRGSDKIPITLFNMILSRETNKRGKRNLKNRKTVKRGKWKCLPWEKGEFVENDMYGMVVV